MGTRSPTQVPMLAQKALSLTEPSLQCHDFKVKLPGMVWYMPTILALRGEGREMANLRPI